MRSHNFVSVVVACALAMPIWAQRRAHRADGSSNTEAQAQDLGEKRDRAAKQDRAAKEDRAAKQDRAAKHEPVAKQEPAEKGVKLAGVRAHFQRVDADRGGALDAAEASKAGLGERDFASHDNNRDQQLSPDEFTVAFQSVMFARGAAISDELTAEASRIRAAQTPAKEKPVAQPPASDAERVRKAAGAPTQPKAPGNPAAQPKTSGPPKAQAAPDAKAVLEGKLDAALRAAENEEPSHAEPAAPRREREVAANVSERQKHIQDKAAAAQDALGRRLRNKGADATTEEQEQARLRKRVVNALDSGAQAAGEGSPPAGDANEAPAAAGAALDQRAKEAQAALDQRLAANGATEEQAAEAREALDRRIKNASGAEATSNAAAPTDPTGDAAANAQASTPTAIADKAKVAEAALEQRLRAKGATEDEISLAKEKLKTRTANALSKEQPLSKDQGADAGIAEKVSQPPPDSAPVDAARAAREALERRLDNNKVEPAAAEKARERLQKRIDGSNEHGKPKEDAAKPSDKDATKSPQRPAPSADPVSKPAPTPKPPGRAANAKVSPSKAGKPIAAAASSKQSVRAKPASSTSNANAAAAKKATTPRLARMTTAAPLPLSMPTLPRAPRMPGVKAAAPPTASQLALEQVRKARAKAGATSKPASVEPSAARKSAVPARTLDGKPASATARAKTGTKPATGGAQAARGKSAIGDAKAVGGAPAARGKTAKGKGKPAGGPKKKRAAKPKPGGAQQH